MNFSFFHSNPQSPCKKRGADAPRCHKNYMIMRKQSFLRQLMQPPDIYLTARANPYPLLPFLHQPA